MLLCWTCWSLFKSQNVAWCWWLTPVILATQEAEIRRISDCGQPRQIVHKTLSWKNPSQKRAGGVVQAAEHLPSKHEDPRSNPQYQKKKKNPRMYAQHFGGDCHVLFLC
jgi:hypothetical protein